MKKENFNSFTLIFITFTLDNNKYKMYMYNTQKHLLQGTLGTLVHLLSII